MFDVTVIIYYNRDRGWINEAVESVYNQVGDVSIELLHSFSPASASKNLNEGIKRASGKYIKYLSEDDLLTNQSIVKSFEFMELNELDFMHGNAFNFTVNGYGQRVNREQRPVILNPTFEQMLKSNVMHGGTLMYRADVLKQYLFDESLDCAEEWELNLRLMRDGKRVAYLNEFLYLYRRHDHQKSLGKAVDQTERAKKIQAIRERFL